MCGSRITQSVTVQVYRPMSNEHLVESIHAVINTTQLLFYIFLLCNDHLVKLTYTFTLLCILLKQD